MNTVNEIMFIQDKVYDLFNTQCAPFGVKYIKMVLTIAQKITHSIDIDSITPDVVYELTESNFHMSVHAIEIIKELDKYSNREYLK